MTPLRLPDFPWDSLAPLAEIARSHPDGMIDLSVGSPIDPTPDLIRDALTAATDAHAYPQTAGTPELRCAIVDWFARRRGVTALDERGVLPTIGSKELVAQLPLCLGLGEGDVVVHPSVAYPTYAVGAALVGATAVAEDDPAAWPEQTRLVWLNSPGNPHGRVLDIAQLRAAVARARQLGAVIASDECYAELAWEPPFAGAPTPSILDPAVVGDDLRGVLAVYSLSKQSNLAGYRAGFAAGCRSTVSTVLEVRKHLGLIPPAPVQRAMVAALGDDEHVAAQRERYRARRATLVEALTGGGYRIDDSEAGLYLWVHGGGTADAAVAAFARLGILVAPGTFYGDDRHVRIALAATDAAMRRAADRIRASA